MRGRETRAQRRTAHNGRAPDVIILDDVDVQGLNPASWQAIAERVRKGHGADHAGRLSQLWAGRVSRFAAGGRAADEYWAGAAAGVWRTAARGCAIAGAGANAAGGAAGSAASGDAVGGRQRIGGRRSGDRTAVRTTWAQLPPLDGANRIERNELKPNAQVLAEADDAAEASAAWWPGNRATGACWRLRAIRRGAGRWAGSARRIGDSGGSACCGWRRRMSRPRAACGFSWPGGA